MKPSFISHSEYQAFLLQQLRISFGPGIVFINMDWPLAVKLWMTDLSAITTQLAGEYSDRGPKPRVDKNLKPSLQRKCKGKKKGKKKGENAPASTPGRVERLVKCVPISRPSYLLIAYSISSSTDCGCSTTIYGRTFYTKTRDDPRLFTKTPRDSEKWKQTYKRRSSIERSNKREKINYKLESGFALIE